MKIQTFQFATGQGWSVSQFPDLDSENTLVLIFVAPEFVNAPDPIKELSKHYPKSKMMGCSTAGEIAGFFVSDNSMTVAVIKFEKTLLKMIYKIVQSSDDSYQAGLDIVADLNQDALSGIFILSDGLKINGSELVKGLNTINQKNVVITGGLAADGSQFKKTWIICNGVIETNSIVALGFYGEHIHIGHGSQGGWSIFGPERRITRSNKNILYELDGQSALELYKEYLGEKASELPASGLLYPLAIREDFDSAKQLVRTILAVDEKEQSLIFAGDMPMGYLAQLMRTNFDSLIAGATIAAKLAISNQSQKEKVIPPILSIAISCVGRRLILGERSEEETESVLGLFPAGTQQIGFYSYGEISPYTIGDCDLHNQTMTITSISEDA